MRSESNKFPQNERLRPENERLRAEIERLRAENEENANLAQQLQEASERQTKRFKNASANVFEVLAAPAANEEGGTDPSEDGAEDDPRPTLPEEDTTAAAVPGDAADAAAPAPKREQEDEMQEQRALDVHSGSEMPPAPAGQ